jgi:aspartyl/asparaginyl beta-hydroxylase (cupin superfamily)
MLIALLAGLEALLYSAARTKRGRARRQQLLMGTSTDLDRAVPLVDNYLKQKTAKATRLQRFVASSLAAVCRRAVHTRSFEYLLLHLVRTAINKRRMTFNNMKRRVSL